MKLLKVMGEIIFYVPFSDETGVEEISWIDNIYSADENLLPKYGIFFNFSKDYYLKNTESIFTMNQGLKISYPHSPIKLKEERINMYINYPSSFIQLDVSREKVNVFKAKTTWRQIESKIKTALIKQVNEFLTKDNDVFDNTTLQRTGIFLNLLKNSFSIDSEVIKTVSYCLQVRLIENRQYNIKIINSTEILLNYNRNEIFYINPLSKHDFIELLLLINEMYKVDQAGDNAKNTSRKARNIKNIKSERRKVALNSYLDEPFLLGQEPFFSEITEFVEIGEYDMLYEVDSFIKEVETTDIKLIDILKILVVNRANRYQRYPRREADRKRNDFLEHAENHFKERSLNDVSIEDFLLFVDQILNSKYYRRNYDYTDFEENSLRQYNILLKFFLLKNFLFLRIKNKDVKYFDISVDI